MEIQKTAKPTVPSRSTPCRFGSRFEAAPALTWLLLGLSLSGQLLLGQSAAIAAEQTVGTLEDPRVYPDRVPAGATRVYWLDDDGWDTPEASLRTNAIGNDQVLFYDIHPPTVAPHARATVLYVHGGGYNGGGASFRDIVDAIEQLTALGFWTISVEYRRGWYNDGDGGVHNGPHPITPEEAGLAERAYQLALDDVLGAWGHIDGDGANAFPYPQRYVLIGQSAGGSLVSRATLISRPADREVLGAIIGFGTHGTEDLVPIPSDSKPAFPIVIQGGVFDDFQGLYDAPPYFQDVMGEGKGIRNLYDELDALGYPTRLLLSAQTGHGFGAYEVCETDECLPCPKGPDGEPTFGDDCGHVGTVTHYPEALDFFESVYYGASPENYVEYLFLCHDPHNAEPGPGVIIDTLKWPGYRYTPYETDLENGLSPAEVFERWGLSNC